MKRMNVIMVFDKECKNILMCKRTKEPYKGLYNMVGGKIENNDNLNEAYRELYEETGITKNDINLIYFMDINYVKWKKDLEIYYGVLNKEVDLKEEVNKLYWISIDENFFDMTKFAGDGNIGHILESIRCDMKEG